MPDRMPRLLFGPLTGRVYIVTRYTQKENGEIVAQRKYDVTKDFHSLVAELSQKNGAPAVREADPTWAERLQQATDAAYLDMPGDIDVVRNRDRQVAERKADAARLAEIILRAAFPDLAPEGQ